MYDLTQSVFSPGLESGGNHVLQRWWPSAPAMVTEVEVEVMTFALGSMASVSC